MTMRLAGSAVELLGALLILAWGALAWSGRPRLWRWWSRRPGRGEGRAVVVVGVGTAVWAVGEGIALVPGTLVQLAGLAVVLAGGAALAVSTTRADHDERPAGRSA